MSHTPGPWEVSGTKAFGLSEILAPKADQRNGFYVCQINQHYYSGPLALSCRIPREISDSNARLISAAPELLAVLKTMVADAEKAVCPSARLTYYEAAKAAIAKAEGKEQP